MRVIAFDLSGIYWTYAFGNQGKSDVEEPYRRTIETMNSLSEGFEHIERFDRKVVAVDAKRTFRHDLLPTYKSKRPERFQWQYDQLDRAIEWARNAGFHVFHADNYEADDILMTCAVWCAQNNHHITVVSDDKDICAALGAGPDVGLLRRNRKTGQYGLINAETFEAAWGFKPHRMPEYLALAGDGSDDFKFFPGIAEETAKKLVIAHESLQDIYDAAMANELSVKVNKNQLEALRSDYVKVYLLALEIATMKSNVPIDLASLDNERPVTLAVDDKDKPPTDAPKRLADDVEGRDGADRTNRKLSEAPEVLERVESRASRAMAVHRKGFELAPFALQPRNMDGAHWLARQAVQSCLFPRFGSVEKALAVILSGRERGISAMVALECAYVVKGQIGWSAVCLAAMVLSSPLCEYFEIGFTSREKAVVRTKRRGRPEQVLEYTIEDAQDAGLLEPKPDSKTHKECNHWLLRPATMLRWAAIREAARAFWPERTTGIFTPAEIRGGYHIEDAEIETAAEVMAA